MPTENENLIPITRDINTLLNLNTYQGMTDEEIELIIDYKINNALNSQEATAKMNAINSEMEQRLAIDRQLAQEAQSMLEYRKAQRIIPWVTIAQDGTVSING